MGIEHKQGEMRPVKFVIFLRLWYFFTLSAAWNLYGCICKV